MSSYFCNYPLCTKHTLVFLLQVYQARFLLVHVHDAFVSDTPLELYTDDSFSPSDIYFNLIKYNIWTLHFEIKVSLENPS